MKGEDEAAKAIEEVLRKAAAKAKLKADLLNTDKQLRVAFGQSIIDKILRLPSFRLAPASFVLHGDFTTKTANLQCTDLLHQIQAIFKKRENEGRKQVKCFRKDILTNHTYSHGSFLEKLLNKDECWGSLDITYSPGKIGIPELDNYIDIVLTTASKIETLEQPTEIYQILKNRAFETEMHMDCHGRPQVTAYFLQKGSTNFFLTHPLIGYWCKHLWMLDLLEEREAFIELVEKADLGTHIVLEENDLALINPGQAHYVWVRSDEPEHVTSIVAVEIPFKLFSNPDTAGTF